MKHALPTGHIGRRIPVPTHVAVALMAGCFLVASYAAKVTA